MTDTAASGRRAFGPRTITVFASRARSGEILKALARSGLDTADINISDDPNLPIAPMVVDCRDLDDSRDLEPVLERVLQLSGTSLIIATFDQLDHIWSSFCRTDVAIACDPAPPEWELLAEEMLGRHDRVHESSGAETDRLREVHLKISTLSARLAEVEKLASVQNQNQQSRSQAELIRNTIRARRLRDRFVPNLLADPAWDILLDLFLNDLEQKTISISSLCVAANVPTTTALRWITQLEEAALVVKFPSTRDRRMTFVALSEKGREVMLAYFSATRDAGLPLV
ncbi:winged helix DNA-binding protein [uncultured Sphingomonas sp.]|uniref:winged helix DNA-binding protein n=1 Tax=uncultured Sphingomonas sp. TaxID=158754 RepID=UPI0035CA0ECC